MLKWELKAELSFFCLFFCWKATSLPRQPLYISFLFLYTQIQRTHHQTLLSQFVFPFSCVNSSWKVFHISHHFIFIANASKTDTPYSMLLRRPKWKYSTYCMLPVYVYKYHTYALHVFHQSIVPLILPTFYLFRTKLGCYNQTYISKNVHVDVETSNHSQLSLNLKFNYLYDYI